MFTSMAAGAEPRFLVTIVLFGLLATLDFAGAQIGVCYGRIGTGLPSPSDVVALYKKNGIGKMRIYDPHQPTLEALRGSNIILILGVANPDLQDLADSQANANNWVQNNVKNYYGNVNIRHIAVGNEVSPIRSETAQYVPYVLPAMRNIYTALSAAGLSSEIKVSTAIETGLTMDPYPPSKAVFKAEVASYINPIIQFLQTRGYPLLANIYPYFAHVSDPTNISLDYALFRSGVNTPDGPYPSLFDAMLDATYSAVGKAGGTSVDIIVSESGWPSSGGTAAATLENAKTYNQNLIRHVLSSTGTPKRPGRTIPTYVFAMFDENQKTGLETERHFGLFYQNSQIKYPIS